MRRRLFTTIQSARKNPTDVRRLRLERPTEGDVVEALTTCTLLRELTIDWYTLKSLPQDVDGLPHLESLSVLNSPVNEIPSFVLKSNKLKHLGFRQCDLAQIPEAIGNLRHLVLLDFWQNHIKGLPESIAFLRRLAFLRVGFNEIEEVPPCVGDLRALSTLDLRKNRICSLPESLEGLRRLRFFSAEGNPLDARSSTLAQKLSHRRQPLLSRLFRVDGKGTGIGA